MLLQINGLCKNFGKSNIIRSLKLDIEEGEAHAIIGPNGAGKSTLFNLITGIYEPTAGSIKLRGKEIGFKTPHEISRMGLSRSFQITNIFPKISVFENIQASLLWSLGYKYSFWQSVNKMKKLKERTEIILEETGMTMKRNVIAGELSYAEQRLLEIGITISSGADVILLDEPMAGLDKHETGEIIGLILNISKGKTLILIEHDMEVVFTIAKRISVMVYGEIISAGSPEAIKNNRQVQESYLGQVA
jgi:branched-chain amino acid transport system ATP-binding protein